jgi:hypothetical protein
VHPLGQRDYARPGGGLDRLAGLIERSGEKLETKPQTLGMGELLYKAEIRFTDIVEYGVRMESITSGVGTLPAEGARFDYGFEGVLRGPRLTGKIVGKDYMYVRADGCFQLHIHGQITTDDGIHVSMRSEGVSIQEEDGEKAQLRAAVSLFSSAPAYRWLNRLQLWAIGTIDVGRGEASIEAYAP